MFNILIKTLLILTCALLFSCKKDPYLYDKPGFDPDTMPTQMGQERNRQINPTQPDPYYQPGGYDQYQMPPSNNSGYYQGNNNGYYQGNTTNGYYQQPYQGRPSYQGQQGYYPPNAGSRFYNNPYDTAPPPSQYYQHYDADQYYVPPNYYRNYDFQQPDTRGKRISTP